MSFYSIFSITFLVVSVTVVEIPRTHYNTRNVSDSLDKGSGNSFTILCQGLGAKNSSLRLTVNDRYVDIVFIRIRILRSKDFTLSKTLL